MKGGFGYKKSLSSTDEPAPGSSLFGPGNSEPKADSISSSPSPLRSIFTRVLCNSRVLMGGSGIEAGIDWVNPRVPFQGLYSHPRVEHRGWY